MTTEQALALMTALQLWVPILIVVALTLVDVAVGVLSAQRSKDFKWAKLPDFLDKRILLQVGGWLLLTLLTNYGTAQLLTQAQALLVTVGVSGVTWMTITLSLLDSIGKSVRELQAPPDTSKTVVVVDATAVPPTADTVKASDVKAP